VAINGVAGVMVSWRNERICCGVIRRNRLPALVIGAKRKTTSAEKRNSSGEKISMAR